MNKKELAVRIADTLKENNQKKYVRCNKTTFYITDDNGNRAEFEINQNDRNVIYTIKDIQVIIDTALEVIENAVKNGESIKISDLGVIYMTLYKGRMFKRPDNGEVYELPPKYVPKFRFGKRLKLAAKIYNLNCFPDKYESTDYLDEVYDNEEDYE